MYLRFVILRRPRSRRFLIACLAVVVMLVVPSLCFAMDSGSDGDVPVSQDAHQANSLWLVSTRHLPCFPHGSQPVAFRYRRFDFVSNCWVESNPSAFAAEDNERVPTSVLVPGSPATAQQTRQIGLKAYKRFLPYLSDGNSIRLVIWTWPSDKVHKRVLKHFRTQATVSEAQGFYLAAFVDQMRPDLRVSLVGYSFGARIVSGGLHLLGGGTLPTAPSYTRIHPERAPIRAVLLAGAIDDHWLLPGRRYGQALTQVERILVTVNGCDPALQRYRLVYGLHCSNQAIGYVGLSSPSRLADAR